MPARSTRQPSPRCWPRRATTSQFGTPDEWAGLAEPDGVDGDRAGAVERRARRVSHRRQDRAGEGARAADARASTRGSASTTANYADVASRVGGGNDHGHSPNRSRERLLRRRQHAGRRRRRDADGVRVQRRPITDRVRPRQGSQGSQPIGQRGCSARRSRPSEAHDRGARSVRHGQLPRHHLQHPQRRERCQGAQPVQGPARRERGQRRSSRSSTIRRTRRRTPRPISTARASPPAATC